MAVQPTEITPLVNNRAPVHTHISAPSPPSPSLSPLVNHIQLHGLQSLDEDPTLFLAPSITPAGQVSFKLLVLLQLYLLTKAPVGSTGKNIWEQWSKERALSIDAEEFQQRAVHIWEEFLRVDRSTQEIEECLWTPFPLEQGRSLSVRLVDILKHPDAPPALVSHRIVILSLLHTWNHGKARIPAGSLSRRILQRFSSVATPRVVHAVDILLQLGYLGLLSHYVLHPPERPIVATLDLAGAREVLLIIYSTASLLSPPTFLITPFVLVSGAFLFSLPAIPFPGDTSYSLLLGALLLHVLFLHLPRVPSPTFLISPQATLPLATFLSHQLTKTLYPCILFFLPATLLASFFLSIALEDSIPYVPPVFTFAQTAPMETRVVFCVLWCILVFLMIISSVLLLLFSTTLLPVSSHMISPWDKYSMAVGLQSRRIFASAVATYSVPYYFPPPFNVLQRLFVHIPQFLSRLFGWKLSEVTEQIEGVLWHLTTGLLVFVVAGCWLWS